MSGLAQRLSGDAGHEGLVAAPVAVKVTVQGAVGYITLQRPEAINAINNAVRAALPAALAALEADPAVRVIVLRAVGPRGFCAGADLRESAPPATPIEGRSQPRSAWFDAFQRVSKPLIAAVHGVCFGGGFEMALACDLRIASADAVFALPETGLGIIPGGGGTQRLPRLIGPGRALHLMLTGERVDAHEALRLGIVTRVVDDLAALHAEADRLAQVIAARPPMAVRFAKEAVQAATEVDLRSGLRLERDLFAFLTTTEDCREAAAAFREKRAAVFQGR